MQLNRNMLSSPIALCILVMAFAGLGVKTLLVDPMNSTGVLSRELTKLKNSIEHATAQRQVLMAISIILLK